MFIHRKKDVESFVENPPIQRRRSTRHKKEETKSNTPDLDAAMDVVVGHIRKQLFNFQKNGKEGRVEDRYVNEESDTIHLDVEREEQEMGRLLPLLIELLKRITIAETKISEEQAENGIKSLIL